jgi:RimJ/RimL family protein N-acetyltransferase
MSEDSAVCRYWTPAECEGSAHCPPRCPRFVDREGHPWVVRPFEPGDRDALVGTYEEFPPGDRAQGIPPRGRDCIEDWLDTVLTEGCNFVAVADGTVGGHALYTPTDDPVPEFAVFVHRDHQDRGLGTELSRQILATAATAEREALTLVVKPSNRAARRLYDRLGFETAEEFTADRAVGRPAAIRMRRPLEEPTTVEYRQPPVVRSGPS